MIPSEEDIDQAEEEKDEAGGGAVGGGEKIEVMMDFG